MKFRCPGQFLISAEYHNGLPLFTADNILNFHTNQRVSTHPFDLLSDGCEAVDKVFVVSEGERGDIWLGAMCTPDTAYLSAFQKIYAHFPSHVLNQHIRSPLVVVGRGRIVPALAASRILSRIFAPDLSEINARRTIMRYIYNVISPLVDRG
jgi:hypothetical protein